MSWNTSPTNGPNLPAEFPEFVVYSSRQLPVSRGEVAIAGFGQDVTHSIKPSRPLTAVAIRGDGDWAGGWHVCNAKRRLPEKLGLGGPSHTG